MNKQSYLSIYDKQGDKLLDSLIQQYYPGQTETKQNVNQFLNMQNHHNSTHLISMMPQSTPIINKNLRSRQKTIDRSNISSQMSGWVMNIKKPRQHSRSLQTLPVLKNLQSKSKLENKLGINDMKSQKKSIQKYIKERYQLNNQKIQQQLKSIQNQSDRYGGFEFLKKQINKQTISVQQANKFYKKRIQSINGSLSLPKIDKVRGIKNIDMLDMKIRRSQSVAKMHEQKPKQKHNYNKWYIKPEERFTKKPLYNANEGLNKQIKQMLENPHKNTQKIKKQLGNMLAQNLINKLKLSNTQQTNNEGL